MKPGVYLVKYSSDPDAYYLADYQDNRWTDILSGEDVTERIESVGWLVQSVREEVEP